MAGHSKWANIKHKKGNADAKRAAVFGKLIKEITVATRLAGADAAANPRLKSALIKAQAANMPKDNIERALKKGSGQLEGIEYQEMTYEAYVPHGIAVVIEVLTDNRNRAASEVRSTLSKNHGSLGTSGSVSFLFEQKGCLYYDGQSMDDQVLWQYALDHNLNIEDIQKQGQDWLVLTQAQDFHAILSEFSQHYSPIDAQLELLPLERIQLSPEQQEKVLTVIDKLEDLDDVQNIYHNLQIVEDDA